MNASKKLMLVIILSFWSIIGYNQNQNIKSYLNVDFKPLPKIDLSEYKSVQERISKNPNLNKQDSKLTIGLAISGGGSRAFFFGIGVLLGLENIKSNDSSKSNFLNEIDYLSTVSGGGFAAGYYLAIKKNVLDVTNESFNHFWLTNLRKKYLIPDIYMKTGLAKNVLYHNLFRANPRREDYLTKVDVQILQHKTNILIKGKNQDIPQLKVKDFFVSKSDTSRKVEMPMLVANGSNYNNSERIAFMPHIIRDLKITKGVGLRNQNDELFYPVPEYDMPLKYAITGSAAFPGVLPQIKFGIPNIKDSIIRVVDGGVYDNLGYKTACELLECDTNSKPNKKLLAVDCSGEGYRDRFSGKIATIIPIIKKELFTTLESKYIDQEREITKEMTLDNLDANNKVVIGFNTIKDNLLPKKEKISISLYDSVKSELFTWKELYTRLYKSLSIKFSKEDISTLSHSEINASSLDERFMLYELSAQVDTKLEITEEEKSVLILAGKYAVYLKKKELEKMLIVQ